MNIKRFGLAVLTASFYAGVTSAADSVADVPPARKLVPDKLMTCPVSGGKLGVMGKAYVMEYNGQEVKLCCRGCKKDFDREPAKFIKKIREADKAGPAGKGAKN